MHNTSVIVTKANGEKEPFNEQRLRRSLQRARIPRKQQDAVIHRVVDSLYENIPTKEIYENIGKFFSQEYPQGMTTYSLKRAIMDLGPSGYPFERYVGALLREYGYDVKVSTIVQGTCVSHEVDVLATKGGEHNMIECKFHNQPGSRSDVKVALYTQARYLDILNPWKKQTREEGTYTPWLITNTKCTSEAIAYAECMHMKLLGWSYPEKDNLQDLIENAGLCPVTCLSSLSNSQKQYLLSKDIVLARDLRDTPSLLEELHLTSEEKEKVERELRRK